MLAEPLILRSNRQAEAENLFSVNDLRASCLTAFSAENRDCWRNEQTRGNLVNVQDCFAILHAAVLLVKWIKGTNLINLKKSII